MKKLFIFFSLYFSVIGLKAQTYIPFPTDINTTWLESRNLEQLGNSKYSNCFEQSTKIVQDTIMNGLKYHRLYMIYVDYTDHTKCASNKYTILKYYGGYIRNDSINKKVYFKLSPTTADTLLYDFDLKIGQLYPETYLSNASPHITSDSVIAIDSVYLNSQWHKRFTLQKNKKKCTNTSTYYLIEGIGGESGFWSNGNCDTLYNSKLECMSVGGLTIYPNASNVPCTIVTGLLENKAEDRALIITPNPTKGGIKIEGNVSIQKITIYNAQGQEIKKTMSNARRFELPQQNGIYIIRVQDDKGRLYSKKVIKE